MARWVSDTAAEPDFPRLAVASSEGLRSGFGLPIRLDGRVIAVIEFLSRRARERDQGTLEMATVLGAELGQFMERARAQEALELRAGQQAVIAELGRRALATPDLATVMEEVAAGVAGVLRVEYCGVLELLPGGDALILRAGWARGQALWARRLYRRAPVRRRGTPWPRMAQ